jgi:hypothetical protein
MPTLRCDRRLPPVRPFVTSAGRDRACDEAPCAQFCPFCRIAVSHLQREPHREIDVPSSAWEAELRDKAPHRTDIAPEQPNFLATLLARADKAKRPGLTHATARAAARARRKVLRPALSPTTR